MITLLHHKKRRFAAAATFVDRHSFLKCASGGSWLLAAEYCFGKSLWLCADQNSPSAPSSSPSHLLFCPQGNFQRSRDITCSFNWLFPPHVLISGWRSTTGRLKLQQISIWKSTVWANILGWGWGGWRGVGWGGSCRKWACVMWFESQMKEIKLELHMPPTPGLNHARRRGEDFRIGTLWAAAPMPRNNPAAPASARPWKLRIWRALWPLLGIIDRFEVGC